MKIAIIGYGKMGKEIEAIARKSGHEITLKINSSNAHTVSSEQLQQCDVAIEFSTPDTAVENIHKCFEAQLPVVVGTTGWYDKFDEIKQQCLTGKHRLFYASNFSIGMNLFFQVAEYTAQMMNHFPQYDIAIKEIHHKHKKDKPSGTAITLAEKIIGRIDRKKNWTKNTPQSSEIFIDSERIGDVPGTHTVVFSSSIDDIQLTHKAHNRKGFAFGAVKAAEWLVCQPAGVYSMPELLKTLTEAF